MTSRSERAQQTRDAMIQAGMRLAETTGLAGMSVNLVVKEAGVAKGSFFHHFGDRAEYLLALHRTFHDELVSETLEASATLQPGAEALWVAAVAFLDGCLRSRAVRALLLEARAIPSIAGQTRKRNSDLAALFEPHFAAMGRPHPVESARLWTGMVAEAALIEFDAGCRQPVMREALRHFLD